MVLRAKADKKSRLTRDLYGIKYTIFGPRPQEVRKGVAHQTPPKACHQYQSRALLIDQIYESFLRVRTNPTAHLSRYTENHAS